MAKITTDDLWENYSFAIRNDKTKEIVYVKVKDFMGAMEIVEEEDGEK